jgi:fructose-1,6-bisphosphatase/inositol monophosphatase family enzyme
MNPNEVKKHTKKGSKEQPSRTQEDKRQQLGKITRETDKKIKEFVTAFLEENPHGCSWLTEEQAFFLVQTRTQLKPYAQSLLL